MTTERFGKYELVRHIASGGMADVWYGKLEGPFGFDRGVAIKRILPHLSRDRRFVEMFIDEARIASNLNHPNIIQIYELGLEEKVLFIAMEYIDGVDLAGLLDIADERGVKLPVEIGTRIVADVLKALDFAHEFTNDDGLHLNIVHRDISPHNVMLSRSGQVKLGDFGVAKAAERHAKTESGVVKGKLSYMAPEQIEKQDLDRRTDIFAMGIVAYETITGVHPFGYELKGAVSILNKEPSLPSSHRPEISTELDDILLRALDKNPEHRYQTAHAMMEALENYLMKQNCFISEKDIAATVLDFLGETPSSSQELAATALDTSAPPDDALAAAPATAQHAKLNDQKTAAEVPSARHEPREETQPGKTSKKRRRALLFASILLLLTLTTSAIAYQIHKRKTLPDQAPQTKPNDDLPPLHSAALPPDFEPLENQEAANGGFQFQPSEVPQDGEKTAELTASNQPDETKANNQPNEDKTAPATSESSNETSKKSSSKTSKKSSSKTSKKKRSKTRKKSRKRARKKSRKRTRKKSRKRTRRKTKRARKRKSRKRRRRRSKKSKGLGNVPIVGPLFD